MKRQGKDRNQLGAAMVEFAIVAMVFFSLVLGLVDFGLGIFYYNTLSNAAREGARVGIINTGADMRSQMCNAAVSRLLLPGVTYNVANGCSGYTPKLDVTAECRDTNDNLVNEPTDKCLPTNKVVVRLTYHYEPITPLVQGMVGLTGGATIPLTGYSSMIKEQ